MRIGEESTCMCRLKGDRGFILVEVVIGFFILSVALVPLLGLFTQALRIDGLAASYATASNLAQKQLELLKAQPPEYWNELDLPCTIPWQDSSQLPGSAYDLQTYGITAAANHYLVQVTVVVHWQEASSDCHADFMTFYSKIK
jgi:type II secretory pathway pseudopilin PulG